MYPQTNKQLTQKNIKRMFSFFSLLVVGFTAFFIYRITSFHIVSTDPNIGSINTVSPFFNIYFNKELVSNGAVITSSPNIISSYHILGKAIYINLNTPLSTKDTYSIFIKKVQDVNHKIINKSFVFTPVFLSPSNLPKDQKAVLRKKQNQYNKTHANPILAN